MGYAIVRQYGHGRIEHEKYPVLTGQAPEAVADDNGGELVDYYDSAANASLRVEQLNKMSCFDPM